jgi:hypothetical protein
MTLMNETLDQLKIKVIIMSQMFSHASFVISRLNMREVYRCETCGFKFLSLDTFEKHKNELLEQDEACLGITEVSRGKIVAVLHSEECSKNNIRLCKDVPGKFSRDIIHIPACTVILGDVSLAG